MNLDPQQKRTMARNARVWAVMFLVLASYHTWSLTTEHAGIQCKLRSIAEHVFGESSEQVAND